MTSIFNSISWVDARQVLKILVARIANGSVFETRWLRRSPKSDSWNVHRH